MAGRSHLRGDASAKERGEPGGALLGGSRYAECRSWSTQTVDEGPRGSNGLQKNLASWETGYAAAEETACEPEERAAATTC